MTLKRYIYAVLTISALALSHSAGADVVSEERARSVAENFLGASQTRSGSDNLTLLWDGEDSMTRSGASDPAFFIYSREGGGFVIVAGDDVAHPILGYSYSNAFSVDEMPENLQGWLSYVRESVNDSRKTGARRTYKIANEWVSIQAGTRAGDTIPAEKNWNTANWNQTAPYNRCCLGHNYVGCVNVAIGILTYFHKWPAALDHEIPGYTDESGNVIPPVSPHEYRWDKIKDSYPSRGYDQEEADACSRLLMDIATLSQSTFWKTATGANFENAVRGAIKYLHYDQGVTCYNRSYLCR